MKKWRYFYIFLWLIVAAFILTRWWLRNYEQLPNFSSAVWNWLANGYGARNAEEMADLEFVVTFFNSISIVFLMMLPGIFLWNRKFPIRQLSGLPCHPAERVIRIALIVIIGFIVFMWIGVIVGDIYFPLSENHGASTFERIRIPLIASIGAIICGNCYRKMSRRQSKESEESKKII